MKCVRCLRDTAKVVAVAPDGSNAWEVYCCTDCNYSWRNTEPEEITDIEKRDAWGQLDTRDFATFKQTVYRTSKKKSE